MPPQLVDPEHAKRIVFRLQQAGWTAFWAGGAVRDLLLGRPFKDIDIATNAPPDAVLSLFPHSKGVGKAFGVVIVHESGSAFEVATFRRDGPYPDGRRPAAVEFASAEADAQRRDFTINAIFFDPVADRYIDFIGGREDLDRKIVRTVGRPADRFSEDHLRLMRAVRFASTLDFRIEPETWHAIRDCASQLARISIERVREEFARTLVESRRPGAALRMMLDAGLLGVFAPELLPMDGQEQPAEYHPEGDVFTHTCMMLDAAGPRDLRLLLAVLLHDVGKPATATWGSDRKGGMRIRFDGHAQVGAEMARSFLNRLRFPRVFTDEVVHMVEGHMRFMDVQQMRRGTLRRLIGSPTFPLEKELHRLDCLCSKGDMSNIEFLDRVEAELAAESALPKPWITGKDVMGLGVAPGPEVGRWLNEAYDLQLEGRVESREALLRWLGESISNPQS